MVHHILNHGIAHRGIYLIFGCRKFNDCLYPDELRDLEERLPGFHYIPTFSRETPAPDINEKPFRTGYVHAVYEEICRNHAGSLPAHFYLCGWKNMIDEAKLRIQAIGYDKKCIHQELYG
jgi:ferredoxin-NADP reductase